MLKNVRLCDTCEPAEQTGFRSCKRGNPNFLAAKDVSTAAVFGSHIDSSALGIVERSLGFAPCVISVAQHLDLVACA